MRKECVYIAKKKPDTNWISRKKKNLNGFLFIERKKKVQWETNEMEWAGGSSGVQITKIATMSTYYGCEKKRKRRNRDEKQHWNAIGSIVCAQSLVHFFSGHTNIIWQMSALIYLFICLSQLTRVNRNDMNVLCACSISSTFLRIQTFWSSSAEYLCLV